MSSNANTHATEPSVDPAAAEYGFWHCLECERNWRGVKSPCPYCLGENIEELVILYRPLDLELPIGALLKADAVREPAGFRGLGMPRRRPPHNDPEGGSPPAEGAAEL